MIEMLISGFDDVEIRDFRLLPAGDRVVALLHTHRRGRAGRPGGRDPRRAHDHLPRREDHLLADLPRPDRGPPGRRPRPRRWPAPARLGLLVRTYASPVGSPGGGRVAIGRSARAAASLVLALGSGPGDRGRAGTAPSAAQGLAPGSSIRRPARSGGPRASPPPSATSPSRSIDRSLGLRGYDYDRQFSSASVSKALLLAAELRRLDSEGLPLDERDQGPAGADDHLLRQPSGGRRLRRRSGTRGSRRSRSGPG